MTEHTAEIEAMPATPERAWQACNRYANVGPTETHPAIVSEAAWLLYQWWLVAEKHDLSINDLANVVSLPVAAMDAIRARARR